MTAQFTRSFTLEDAHIRAGGDGRTVEAFTAVFDVPAPISDQQGRYIEENDRAAFNKTVADNGTRFGVFYNHGATIHGTPSDMFSMPLGVPAEPPRVERMSVDGREMFGLLTVTRYEQSELGDQVLQGIRSGSIRGYSYSGKFVRSTPDRVPRGGFRPDAAGNLTKVRRMEIAMREYGPTPFPAFTEAAIFGVRSRLEALAGRLDDETLERLLNLATPLEEPAERSDTPEGAVSEEAEEPQQHSGRQSLSIAHLRWMAREKGVL